METGDVQQERKPKKKGSDHGRALLQLVAMLTMLTDHIGFLLFPEDIGWRIVGRLAFPLYAYSLVQGYLHTANVGKYLKRMGWLALLSQIPFMLAINTWKINVICTLLVSAAVLYLMDRLKHGSLSFLVAAAAILAMEWIPMDYGAYALLLILIYRYSPAGWMFALHLSLTLLFIYIRMPMYQLASVLATVWLLSPKPKLNQISWAVPRWLWLAFYPVHLTLLFVLKSLKSFMAP